MVHMENEKREKFCKICDKMFESVKEYNEHKQTNHLINVCKVCCKSFKNVKMLRLHMISHMGKEQVQKKNDNTILQVFMLLQFRHFSNAFLMGDVKSQSNVFDK